MGACASDRAIKILESQVIDCIAAGEVVERPASVVKELLENALDAGATAIDIDMCGGGLEALRVSDNGCGMGRADAQLSLLRHATSKLATADDLHQIHTFGFRGEALACIAAVSRLTLTTRRAQDEVATRVRAEAGHILEVTEVGGPVGTSVEVCDLFFNTPARRKFLRAAATEQAHVVDAASRVVLGVPGVGLVVLTRGRRLVDISASPDAEARALAAFGGRRLERLWPINSGGAASRHQVRVEGLVGPPAAARGDAKGLWLFVNGRHVRDRMLQRAVAQGCEACFAPNTYPYALIYVSVAPDAVDVNVHPQKTEVRFADASAVFRAVAAAVAATMEERRAQMGLSGHAVVRKTVYGRDYGETDACVATAQALYVGDHVAVAGCRGMQATPLAARSLEVGLAAAGQRFGALQPLGRALRRYLVCAAPHGLTLVDLQMAAQRLVAVRLRADMQAEAARRSLEWLLPERVELSSAAVGQLADGGSALLQGLGCAVEPIGPRHAVLRATPRALGPAVDGHALVADLLQVMHKMHCQSTTVAFAGRPVGARTTESVNDAGAAAWGRADVRAALVECCARHAPLPQDGTELDFLRALDAVEAQEPGVLGEGFIRWLGQAELAQLF